MRTCTAIKFRNGSGSDGYSINSLCVESISMTPYPPEYAGPGTYDVHFKDGTCVTVYSVEQAFYSADTPKGK